MGFSLVRRQWQRLAFPTSWRPFTLEHYWLEHDVVISSEGGGSGRRQFEVHVLGRHFANRQRLDDAKEAVEKKYGPLQWRAVRLDKVQTDHRFYGPTTEFTSPTTIWVAELGEGGGVRKSAGSPGSFDKLP